MGGMAVEKKIPGVDRRGAKPGSRKGTDREGRPGNIPHVPTPESRATVEKLAGLQITQHQIGLFMGFSRDVVQTHYADEFERGHALKGVHMRQSAYAIAQGVPKDPNDLSKGWEVPPNERLLMFLLERVFGMIQQTRNEHMIGEMSPEAAAWLGKNSS